MNNCLFTISLDYGPGLHGHFLEYIVNRYIYRIECSDVNIFQGNGSAHAAEQNKDYLDKRVVLGEHRSYYNSPYPDTTEKVIFVSRDPTYDFVLLVNIVNRCHWAALNLTAEEIRDLHLGYLDSESDVTKRTDWYAKLFEEHLIQHSYQQPTELPTFNFRLASFFDLALFCEELTCLAKFLNERFVFDESLVPLWEHFIQNNQGWHKFQQANQIFNSIIVGNNRNIVNDWQIHAYLNYRFSKTFEIYDGPMFESDYPRNTLDAHNLLVAHICNSS